MWRRDYSGNWLEPATAPLEARIRNYQEIIAEQLRIWQGVLSMDSLQESFAVRLEKWSKMWENLGVAHTAAVEMKEVHYDAKSGEITNKAAICSGVSG